MTTLSTDQSSNLKLIYRKGEGRPITFNMFEGSEAYDISALTFVFELFGQDGGDPILTLEEGDGVTNGGVSGVLTINPTDADVDIDPITYLWKLRVTSPAKMTWFNGFFIVNDAPLLEVEVDEVTVQIDLGDITVDVTLNITEAIEAEEGGVSLRDAYDASVDEFPETGGSGTAGAVKKGNLFPVSVAGTLDGELIPPGSLLLALTDNPGQTATNWRILT